MFDNKKWVFTSGYIGFNLKKNASLNSNGLLIEETDGIAISTTDGNAPTNSNIDLANSYITYSGTKYTATSIVIDSSRLVTDENNRLKFQSYDSSNGTLLQINADSISATWYGAQNGTYPNKFRFVKTGLNAITVSQDAKYANFVFISEIGTDVYPNLPPTNIGISYNQISEIGAIGDLIGTLQSIDQRGGTITYSFTDTQNYPNNTKFTINNGMLYLNGSLDYETQPQVGIKIRATDPQGLYADAVIIINVLDDLSDNPVAINPNQVKIANGRYLVSHSRDPRVAAFTVEGGGEIPLGSLFCITPANGQTIKLIKNTNNYFAITPAIKAEWKWSQSAQDAWAVLYSM